VTTRQPKVHTQQFTRASSRGIGPSAVQIFAANERMNQILIEHLDPTAWRADPLGADICMCVKIAAMADLPAFALQARSRFR